MTWRFIHQPHVPRMIQIDQCPLLRIMRTYDGRWMIENRFVRMLQQDSLSNPPLFDECFTPHRPPSV